METNSQVAPKTWKPVTAGILDIVGGVLTVLGAVALFVGIMFFIPISRSVGPGPVPEMERWMVPGVLETILVIGVVYLLVVGILPIIGGIFAVQRRKWGLALAGSIAAIFGTSVLGILATIFTAISKDEFE
ncbi:hypothetical protein ACFLV5_04105 [Chloroflexota bacterium]